MVEKITPHWRGMTDNERVRASLANHTPRLTLTAAIRFGYVNKLQTFNAGNVFAVTYPAGDAPDSRYVVYSYGWHWPMYIKQGVQWYGNADKYSVTTSKHASQFTPNQTQETPTLNPMTCAQMLDIAEHGIAGMVLGKQSKRGEQHILVQKWKNSAEPCASDSW